jgi:hypothetical protein
MKPTARSVPLPCFDPRYGPGVTAQVPPEQLRPAVTIQEALERMTAIGVELPTTDGVACFNRMYDIVTSRVLAEVSLGTFYSDNAFMAHLDVVFANLYFGALDGAQTVPPTAPACWRELFAQRSNLRIAPLQFALAGMSAHINHDLPLAVLKTCVDLATTPESFPHEADFKKVNALLENLDQGIRESFETGELLAIDRRAAGLENLVGGFGIAAARSAAWESAISLWHLRNEERLTHVFVDGLDAAAAAAGRVLLTPLL